MKLVPRGLTQSNTWASEAKVQAICPKPPANKGALLRLRAGHPDLLGSEPESLSPAWTPKLSAPLSLDDKAKRWFLAPSMN